MTADLTDVLRITARHLHRRSAELDKLGASLLTSALAPRADGNPDCYPGTRLALNDWNVMALARRFVHFGLVGTFVYAGCASDDGTALAPAGASDAGRDVRNDVWSGTGGTDASASGGTSGDAAVGGGAREAGSSGSGGSGSDASSCGPSPDGCALGGCPSGQLCDAHSDVIVGDEPSAECAPLSCVCQQGQDWVDCWTDCGGGRCITDPDIGCEESLSRIESLVAPQLPAQAGSCGAMALVSPPIGQVLAYSIVCGARISVDESAALEVAQTETPSLFDPPFEVLPPQNDDAFIINAYPDDFGGAIAVSARTGLVIAGIKFAWTRGQGISFPTELHSPSDLSRHCSNPVRPTQVRGFAVGDPVSSLSTERQRIAVDAVWSTSLPAALERAAGPLRDAIVLRYPYDLDGMLPEHAEAMVVLISAGAP